MSRPRALTPEQVGVIRDAYASGDVAASTLATRYGVSWRTIMRAVKGVHRPPVTDRDPHAWGRRPDATS